MSEPFDRAAVLDRFNHDAELVREMVRLFEESSRQWLAELRTALASGDLQQAYRTAHTLKGSMGNFLATQPVAAVARFEALCRSGDKGAAVPAFRDVEVETGRLLQALTTLSAEGPA
jgi:HPt (histidine-containing phosphotransfer) domain-containing protein